MTRVNRLPLILSLLSGLCVSFFFVTPALANNPSIDSVSLSASSISNNLTDAISWSISNGGGAFVAFNCPVGVTVYVNGGAVTCGAHVDAGAGNPGVLTFSVINVTGTTKSFSITLYPKDSNGSEYAPGAQNVTLTVTTSYQPITSFVSSATSTPSGGTITLTWTGVDITYSNMQINCPTDVRVESSGTRLTCDGIAFTSPLSQSGSVTLTLTNSSSDSKSLTAYIYPGSGGSTYDATHAKAVSFTVLGKVAAATPSVTSFSGPTGQVVSGAPTAFSWVTANASGAGIQFPCSSNLSYTSLTGSTSSAIYCDAPAFATPLSTTGSTTISITNKNAYTQYVTAVLMPVDSSGTYLGTQAKLLSFAVLPPGQVPTAQTSTYSPPPASAPTTVKPSAHAPITVLLLRGSKNSQVTILQTFLSLNSSVYPEGSVTGFFGPATERAVQKLQVKYGIAKSGEAGYGLVGPKTRALINSLTTP